MVMNDCPMPDVYGPSCRSVNGKINRWWLETHRRESCICQIVGSLLLAVKQYLARMLMAAPQMFYRFQEALQYPFNRQLWWNFRPREKPCFRLCLCRAASVQINLFRIEMDKSWKSRNEQKHRFSIPKLKIISSSLAGNDIKLKNSENSCEWYLGVASKMPWMCRNDQDWAALVVCWKPRRPHSEICVISAKLDDDAIF